MSDDFNVMVRDGPGRRDEHVSVGELRLGADLTDDEQELVAALYAEEDAVFDYAAVAVAASMYQDDPDALADGDAQLSGRLGSLVNKGVLHSEQYTTDEIDALVELNEEHDGMIRPDELDAGAAYEDVLSKQGAVYVRSTAAKSVDAGMEPGRSLFTLSEQGREYGEFLTR